MLLVPCSAPPPQWVSVKDFVPIAVNVKEDHFHKLSLPLRACAHMPCFLFGHCELTVLPAKINTSTCVLDLIFSAYSVISEFFLPIQ